jgi:hypothetical protein
MRFLPRQKPHCGETLRRSSTLAKITHLLEGCSLEPALLREVDSGTADDEMEHHHPHRRRAGPCAYFFNTPNMLNSLYKPAGEFVAVALARVRRAPSGPFL